MSAQQPAPNNATKDALVLFMPSGKRGRFAHGTPVLEAGRQLGVYIESVCGGRGICGKCQIEVAEGEFAKHGITSRASHLSDFGPNEQRYKDKRDLKDERRLSCSALIQGDIVIDIPADAQSNAQVVRKSADTADMARNPAIRLYYVDVDQPDMHNPLGDADRVIRAVEQQFGLENVTMETALYPTLQKLLRKADWQVTLCVHTDNATLAPPTITAIYPGYSEVLHGLAVDIGSTTIAAHLTDMMSGEIVASTGISNPQIRFGEDLMSRVSYVMMNEGGDKALTQSVRGAINECIDTLLEQANVARASIMDAVFVANPVMHHLFLGLDPTELGQAPFALTASGAQHYKASDLGLGLGLGARTYILPCIAGHVGADAAAVALAQKPQTTGKKTLVVDVGTNAEILLSDGNHLVAASSPTGPAFEGAEISCGQRAAPGAIERVRIDPQTLQSRIRIIGAEFWSNEPEFFGASQKTGVTGVCGSGIIEVVGEMLIAGILSIDGVIRGPQTEAEKPFLIEDGRTFSYVLWQGTGENAQTHTIRQVDIRAIQLAKAALYAGIKLLMDKQNIDTVDEVRLAGAFGSFIDPKYALVLGLVPDCVLGKVTAVGNAAGQGALMALLDIDARREIETLVTKIEKIETALEPKFQEHFVNAMALPNKVDPFTLLRTIVSLPELPAQDSNGPRRRRRKR